MTEAKGKIQALALLHFKEEKFEYEKLTIILETPQYQKLQLVDFKLEDPTEMIPKDTPRGTRRQRSEFTDDHGGNKLL